MMHHATLVVLYVSFLIGILPTSLGLSLRTSDNDDPSRYSACYPDRGYTKDDADVAGSYLWRNATFDRGLNLTTNECIYRTVNTTVVSLCNGSARNRTVNRNEVRRGVEQLMKDCGKGGTFNGVHVVNNLTFASWGITGPRTAAIPPGSPPPDLPGRRDLPRSGPFTIKTRQDLKDPCTGNFFFDGTQRFDCRHVNQMDPTGLCPGELNPDNKCSRYCEVWRVGFLGIEQTIPGDAGEPIQSGFKPTLQAEWSLPYLQGIRSAKEYSKKFSLREYLISESVTTTLATSKEPTTPIPDGKFGRWVAFPKYIETCGSITRQKYVPGASGGFCGVGCVPEVARCVGDVETVGHQCTRTPALDSNGNALVFYSLRFEDCKEGKCTILPWNEQSQDYRTLCGESGDPDKDGETECHYGGIAPPPAGSQPV